MIAIGLMAGTSLDGIDAVRVALRARADGFTIATEAFAVVPFAADLRARIVGAFPPQAVDALEISALHAAIGAAFGAAACAVGVERADFVASHGVTFAHDGAARQTLQLGDPFRIREATGRTVIYDFRSADTAAGGEGAPLVPYVDGLLFGDAREERVALNLGGIANITVLRPGAPGGIALAFDCGPANLPIDAYVASRSGGAERIDRDGARALRGTAAATLVARMLADPYFALPPPKSTGRERFGATFVEAYRGALDALEFDDAVATLTALSVESVAAAVRGYAPAARRLIVGGGGSRNPALVGGLQAALPGLAVEDTAAYGIDPDAKEAIAFAILGYEALRERPAGLPQVTGARGPRVLGGFVPSGLAGLLGRLHAEETAHG
jgi:anhydro-N-acetylmuramic acid kinase